MNFDKFMSCFLIIFGIFLIQLPIVAIFSYCGNGSICQDKESPSYTAAILFGDEKIEIEVQDYYVWETFVEIKDRDGNIYIIDSENVMMKGR